MSFHKYRITNGVQLIGIAGHAGAGKDTVADYICKEYDNTYRMSFADPLKKAAANAFGIPEFEFYDAEDKERINHVWHVSPRMIAQFFGTEMFRETINTLLPGINNDFWVKRMCERINGSLLDVASIAEGTVEYCDNFEPGDSVVIPDVRFANEYDWIVENGGIVIRLTRHGAEGNVGLSGHKSEAGFAFRDAFEPQSFDIINNGTLEELYAQVDKAMLTTEF